MGALALWIRLDAASQLGMDHDEGVYLDAARRYADATRDGDWRALLEGGGNPEHPPLLKLLFGLGLVAGGPDLGAHWQLAICRGFSAVGGALGAALLARAAPLGGLAMALHTLHAKYTAEAYLEAWPALAATAAVLAAARGRPLWSAMALGLAAACKYPYAIAALPAAVGWALARSPRGEATARPQRAAARLIRGLVLAGLTALALDPWLWPDPSGRLLQSLGFHPAYAAVHAGPWWEPLRWLARSWGAVWHPEVFAWGVDGALTALGAAGLWRGRRSLEGRLMAIWALAALALLMAWPTKWPHYVLVLLPPLLWGVDRAIRRRV